MGHETDSARIDEAAALDTECTMNEASSKRLCSDFGVWMKTHLGYRATQSSSEGPGMLWGERWSTMVGPLRLTGSALLGVAFVWENWASERAREGALNPNVLLALCLSSYAAAQLWKWHTREWALITCRVRTTPFDADDLRSLLRPAGTSTSKRRRARLIVVSATAGFTEDAAELAGDLGVDCYRRTDRGFELVRRSAP